MRYACVDRLACCLLSTTLVSKKGVINTSIVLINVLLSISLLRPVAVANPATIVESAGLIESTEHSLPLVKQVCDNVSSLLRTSHLLAPFPEVMIDSAFFDRFHSYIPGWEIPKMRPEFFTDRYGFNNSDKIWDEERIDYVLIGDSFIEGYCQNNENTIAENLRKLLILLIVTQKLKDFILFKSNS